MSFPTDTARDPHPWTLEPGRVFLNHGSYGACPRPVLQLQQEIRDQLERSPSDFMARLPRRLEAAREEMAEFLQARPEELAWTPNATSGVNAVLRSLPWQAGQEILTTDHVYNACGNVLDYLAETSGVRVVRVALPFPDPGDICGQVLGAVTPATRLALLDHVTSATALVLPIAELAGRLRDRGVKVLVDGAHAPGMLPLDLSHLGQAGVSFYSGNLHKWCCAPKGSGFLWAALADQRGLHPSVISHGYNSPSPRSRFLEEFDWCGTFDPSAWLAAPASIQLLEELFPGGWEGLRGRCRALLLEGREVLAAVLPEQSLSDPALLGQMASLQLPPAADPPRLFRELYDEFGIDAMLTSWNGRPLLRLSAAPYNSLTDYHALAAALRHLTARHRWDDLEETP